MLMLDATAATITLLFFRYAADTLRAFAIDAA